MALAIKLMRLIAKVSTNVKKREREGESFDVFF
jgi:hypothetical protein